MNTQTLLKSYLTKEEYVYNTLRAAIMGCELKPGEKLVIDNLSAELGVSPIPVRAALQRLQAEGLVEITPHTGAVVSKISPDLIREIFMLLEVLEAMAFRVLVDKADLDDIVHLRQLVEAMEVAFQADDVSRWSDLNMEFHRAVAQITQMKMLIEFTGRVWDSWNRLRHCYLKPIVSARMPQSQAEHQQMIALLERRDVEELAALAVKHNRQARETYQQLLQNQNNAN
ncbi:MAG: GntR family transcriptional regulator [Anaerolineae bacterium]|nr:GntR family transcriptional regulator [Anaerolineae bacterium]